MERRVSGGVLDLGVGHLELVNELACHVHVAGGDVQRRVATERLVALLVQQPQNIRPQTYIKYSLDLLRPIETAETFEAVDWLADLRQRTWPQAGRR